MFKTSLKLFGLDHKRFVAVKTHPVFPMFLPMFFSLDPKGGVAEWLRDLFPSKRIPLKIFDNWKLQDSPQKKSGFFEDFFWGGTKKTPKNLLKV